MSLLTCSLSLLHYPVIEKAKIKKKTTHTFICVCVLELNFKISKSVVLNLGCASTIDAQVTPQSYLMSVSWDGALTFVFNNLLKKF